MLITRQNLKGGRKLTGFPISEMDGCNAYKIGYCAGCNEPLGIRTLDVREVVDFFGLTEVKYKKLMGKFRPRLTFKQWLIKWLGGTGTQVVENY